MSCLLQKYPGETRTYAFDFAEQVEIADGGETLTGTPTVAKTQLAGTGTITLGSPSIVGNKVQFTITGGDKGDLHDILVTVGTSGSATLQARGQLEISQPC
jgi:hypothetical protein